MIYVIKEAKIRNQYNQVPNLTQDNTWERDYNTRKHHIQENQKDSPFPAGGHNAAMDRQDIMTGSNQRIYKSLSPRARPLLYLQRLKYWGDTVSASVSNGKKSAW